MNKTELTDLLSRSKTTQREVAERCGVSGRTVRNWVSGKTRIPVLAEQEINIMVCEKGLAQDEATETDADRDSESIIIDRVRNIARLEKELRDEREALEKALETSHTTLSCKQSRHKWSAGWVCDHCGKRKADIEEARKMRP